MTRKTTLAALEKVVTALAPLDAESRRRVIEATHALMRIGPGRLQNRDAKSPAKKRR